MGDTINAKGHWRQKLNFIILTVLGAFNTQSVQLYN